MNSILRRPALWAASAFLVVLAAAAGTTPVDAGLYNWKTSKVVQLTEKNFQSLVLDSKETWYVLVRVLHILIVVSSLWTWRGLPAWCSHGNMSF